MSPKTMIIAAAAIAAASVTALSASAAPPADPTPPAAGVPAIPPHPAPLRATILFNLIDRNGDGVIDQDELAAFNKAVFLAIDTNADGKISADEFDRALPAFMGGGQPRVGQFWHGGPQNFHRFGMMGPGFHRPGGIRQGWLQNGQAPAGPGGPQQQLGDNDQAQGPQQDFATLDKNGDGVITPDEFAPGAAPAPAPTPAPQQ